MNKFYLLGGVLAASIAGVHAHAEQQASVQIVNGSDASVADYPSFASLFQWVDYNGGSVLYGKYCGASILNADYILTAAHCVYINSSSSERQMLFTYVFPQLQNEAEANLVSSSTTKIRISEVHYHESYNYSTLLNDIAILKLESSLSLGSTAYANRATTADEASYKITSASFQAVGHGNTSTGNDTTDVLQYANLTYLPIVLTGDSKSCNYSSISTTNNLCMEGVKIDDLETSTCQGDSGGPLYWADGSNQRLVGLTSFGPATFCGDPDYSGTSVFTQVSRYQSWIDNVITGARTPDYTFTETERQAFRDSSYTYKYTGSGGTNTVTASNSSSSSGGSLPFWGLSALGVLAWLRRR